MKQKAKSKRKPKELRPVIIAAWRQHEKGTPAILTVARVINGYEYRRTVQLRELLTLHEAAEAIGISRVSLWRLTENKHIKCYKLAGMVAYRLEDIRVCHEKHDHLLRRARRKGKAA